METPPLMESWVHIPSAECDVHPEQPSTSCEQPSSTAGEPSSTAGEPSSSGGEPSSTGEEPSRSAGEPSSTGEEPSSIDEDPIPSREHPSTVEGVPVLDKSPVAGASKDKNNIPKKLKQDPSSAEFSDKCEAVDVARQIENRYTDNFKESLLEAQCDGSISPCRVSKENSRNGSSMVSRNPSRNPSRMNSGIASPKSPPNSPINGERRVRGEPDDHCEIYFVNYLKEGTDGMKLFYKTSSTEDLKEAQSFFVFPRVPKDEDDLEEGAGKKDNFDVVVIDKIEEAKLNMEIDNGEIDGDVDHPDQAEDGEADQEYEDPDNVEEPVDMEMKEVDDREVKKPVEEEIRKAVEDEERENLVEEEALEQRIRNFIDRIENMEFNAGDLIDYGIDENIEMFTLSLRERLNGIDFRQRATDEDPVYMREPMETDWAWDWTENNEGELTQGDHVYIYMYNDNLKHNCRGLSIRKAKIRGKSVFSKYFSLLFSKIAIVIGAGIGLYWLRKRWLAYNPATITPLYVSSY